MKAITPKQLHKWYLEAVRDLNDLFYNKRAEVPFEKLTAEQKSIDEYIADKINEHLHLKYAIKIEFEAEDLDKE